MNIKARINARRIVLSFFYEKYITQNLGSKDNVVSEILNIDKNLSSKRNEEEGVADKSVFFDILKNYYSEDFQGNIDYLIKNAFAKQVEDGVDLDYIQNVGTKYDIYKDQIKEKVDSHTSSFAYDQMDTLDKMIFLMGYIEFKELHTPKEIVLNEMVEMAKKYGDEGSAKLINGIMHKIIMSELQETPQTTTDGELK